MTDDIGINIGNNKMTDQEIRSELRLIKDEIKEAFQEFRNEMRTELAELKKNFVISSNVCAAEREKNQARSDKLDALETEVSSIERCHVCKQEARLARIETILNIVVKVAYLLSASSISLMLKAGFDFFTRG